MNKVAVDAVAIILAGAAGFGTFVYPSMKARAEVDKALATLPAGSEGRYRDLSYSLFSGRLSLSDLEVKIPGDGGPVVTRTARLVLEDLKDNYVGKVSAKDLVIEQPGAAQITAAELSGSNLDGYTLSEAEASNKLDRLALSDVTLTVAGESVKMREVVLSNLAVADRKVRSLALGVHGLQLAIKEIPNAEAQELLSQLGYANLALNFDFAFAHAPESQLLTIKTIALGGDEMGRLTLSGRFGNVPSLDADDPILAQAMAAAATLEQLELRYEDSSLAGRVLKYAAAQQGTEEGALRTQLMDSLAEQGNAAGLSPLGRQAIDSARTFLASPKSLSLKAEPQQPVPLFQLVTGSSDPDALANAMRLSVAANK